MNRQGREPVVRMSTGGRGGGGASLTDARERAIASFWSLWGDLEAFLDERTRGLRL